MATLPVYNATIPYLAEIPGGLYHGSMLRVKGSMHQSADRFVINVQTGAAVKPCDDVNLHLSVRPSEGAIVRNTLQSQIWGSEERYGGCPIYPGSPFEIIILAQAESFKIAVNGTHFCQFNHRLPMSSARFLHISGDVSIQSMIKEHDSVGGPAVQPIHPIPPVQPIYPIHPTPPPQHHPGYPAVPYPGCVPVYPPSGSPHVPPHLGFPSYRPMTPNEFRPASPYSPHHYGTPGVPGYSHLAHAHQPDFMQNQRNIAEEASYKHANRSRAMHYAASAAGVGLGVVGVGLGAAALATAISAANDSDSD